MLRSGTYEFAQAVDSWMAAHGLLQEEAAHAPSRSGVAWLSADWTLAQPPTCVLPISAARCLSTRRRCASSFLLSGLLGFFLGAPCCSHVVAGAIDCESSPINAGPVRAGLPAPSLVALLSLKESLTALTMDCAAPAAAITSAVPFLVALRVTLATGSSAAPPRSSVNRACVYLRVGVIGEAERGWSCSRGAFIVPGRPAARACT